VQIIGTGTKSIPGARNFLGLVCRSSGATVTAVAYKGASVVSGEEIGACIAAGTNAYNTDEPVFPCATDKGLFVNSVGLGGVTLIRYET